MDRPPNRTVAGTAYLTNRWAREGLYRVARQPLASVWFVVVASPTANFQLPSLGRIKLRPCCSFDGYGFSKFSVVLLCLCADVWAAGVLSYELLVGFTPMVGPPAATAAAAARLAQQPDCPVSQFVTTSLTPRSLHFPASLSQASRDFVLAALAENPGDRPTARELQRYDWLCG